MNVYFGNDRKDATLSMTPTPAKVNRLPKGLKMWVTNYTLKTTAHLQYYFMTYILEK